MAGAITSAKDFVPYSRSATSPASTMLGTSAGINPATGMMPFKPALFRRRLNFARLQIPLAEKLGGGELGHRADAGDGVDLAVLGANQDGRFAAEAEVRIFDDRPGEHRRHTRVHGVSAFEVERACRLPPLRRSPSRSLRACPVWHAEQAARNSFRCAQANTAPQAMMAIALNTRILCLICSPKPLSLFSAASTPGHLRLLFHLSRIELDAEARPFRQRELAASDVSGFFSKW